MEENTATKPAQSKRPGTYTFRPTPENQQVIEAIQKEKNFESVNQLINAVISGAHPAPVGNPSARAFDKLAEKEEAFIQKIMNRYGLDRDHAVLYCINYTVKNWL